MKNLSAILKIFVLALVVIIPAKVSAELDYRSVDVTYLKGIVGNWYDTKGNLVLTISSDYKLNGMKIMSVGFTGDAGGAGYKITYKDGNQNKFIEVWVTGSREPEHDILLLNGLKNNNSALRKTKNPLYFESIGGIYLGMDQNEVLRLYGEPSSKENFNIFLKRWVWKYKNLGLEVSVYGGIVTAIQIYSYGDRRFDWSGLSANSSRSAFANKYRTEISRRGNLNIGHGEVISLRNNSVVLQIFTSGFVF